MDKAASITVEVWIHLEYPWSLDNLTRAENQFYSSVRKVKIIKYI